MRDQWSRNESRKTTYRAIVNSVEIVPENNECLNIKLMYIKNEIKHVFRQ